MPATGEALREIDLATAPAFSAAMRGAIDSATGRTVTIDCSAITFMDSSGFHALMDAHRYALEQDSLLVIRGLRSNCARVVRICDVAEALTIAP